MISIIICAILLVLAAIFFFMWRRARDQKTIIEARQKTIERQAAELRHALKLSNLQLAELSHRVKNDIQAIESALSMRLRRSKDKSSKAALKDAQGRLRALSIIHEMFLADGETDTIRLGDYLNRLLEQLGQIYSPDEPIKPVEAELEIGSDKAAAIGFIVHELFANACQHGHRRGCPPEVHLEIRDRDFNISVFERLATDSDIEHSETALKERSPKQSMGLGLELIEDFAHDIDGRIEAEHAEGGMKFSVVIPRDGKAASASADC